MDSTTHSLRPQFLSERHLGGLLLGRHLDPQTRISAGLLLDSPTPVAWVVTACEALSRIGVCDISAVFIQSSSSIPPSSARLFSKYRRWATARFENQTGSAAPDSVADIQAALPNVSFLPFEREAVIARKLDVLLWLGHSPMDGDCSQLARYGVWSIAWGKSNRAPIGFWEIYAQEPVSEIAIQLHTARFDRAQTLRRCTLATDQNWVYPYNAVERSRAAAAILVRCILDLAEFGPAQALRAAESATTNRSAVRRHAGDLQVLGFVLKQSARSLRLRLKNQGRTWEWFSVLQERNADSLRSLDGRDVVPAPGRSYADPFLVEYDGRTFLFVEDIPPAGPARLAVLEVHDGGSLSEPVVILERPYHLSYPCVFRDRGDFFMIPESSENGTVELYRATRFPYEWSLEKVLCENVLFVDTTPLFHDGVWYFFTTAFDAGLQALLFSSPRLDGPWTYHPANPISCDVRRARGAGHIFQDGGRLIRPAQDCSLAYGYAIVLNQITRLSPADYAEQPIQTILPDWRPGILCTHTLNRSEHWQTLDAVRTIPKRS